LDCTSTFGAFWSWVVSSSAYCAGYLVSYLRVSWPGRDFFSSPFTESGSVSTAVLTLPSLTCCSSSVSVNFWALELLRSRLLISRSATNAKTT